MSDEQDRLAAAIFCALVGEGLWDTYEEESEIRSAPNSPTVDVRIGEQWYRITSEPIDEPISLAAHRDEARHP